MTTLQKACTNAQFEANPAGCPSESKIGYATVHTPLLPVPLTGPAIFVSHGGEAFPSLTMVLQGYGVTVDLVGTTFISKAGVTTTTFKTVPDVPFSTFELTLPEGKYSALAANGNLCTEASKLKMPTEFIAQNGARDPRDHRDRRHGLREGQEAGEEEGASEEEDASQGQAQGRFPVRKRPIVGAAVALALACAGAPTAAAAPAAPTGGFAVFAQCPVHTEGVEGCLYAPIEGGF